jgi:hypothetical protein
MRRFGISPNHVVEARYLHGRPASGSRRVNDILKLGKKRLETARGYSS